MEEHLEWQPDRNITKKSLQYHEEVVVWVDLQQDGPRPLMLLEARDQRV